tara:strand:- start:520 stop:1137 length:618 start_codon:yes stop_codon:yes gene_type:complete
MQDLLGTFFVTGTSTSVGKTYATAALLKLAQKKGRKVLGLKPIASGADNGINADALALMESSNVSLSLSKINPFCFEPAIAPHIAAAREQVVLTSDLIVDGLRNMLDLDTDLCLIEGAGGWAVPINDEQMWADVVRLMDVPVVLIVGMTLGCINHALLTERAILADNCVLHGWIANPFDPNMEAYQENLDTLKARMKSPFLGSLM